MLNKHDVLKILGDDFDPDDTLRCLLATSVVSATALLTALALQEDSGHEDKEQRIVLMNRMLLAGVAGLVAKQDMPLSVAALKPLPDGSLNDLAELAQTLLSALRFGSCANESTVLFMVSQVLEAQGMDFERELKKLVREWRRADWFYPPQERGEPDSEQGAP